jgi:hypothetical protein
MEFSDIALAKLLQTLPELGSLILTFQDLSEEISDESGIQVGVFILRSGADLFYVPVVSKSDNVYPIDSIFFDSKKKFFPLTKKTVNLVMASSQVNQGKATTIPKTVVENPSVYGLITPPRTGKYAYASASRLTDFLASMPNHLKQFTFEKFAAEKSVYDELDKMFSLKAIFDVLKPTPAGAAQVTNAAPISIATGAGPNVDAEALANIVRDGYAIVGENPNPRVAVSVQDYNSAGVAKEISEVDGDRDYEIAFASGPSREAFVPKMHKYSASKTLAVFTNGDYAVSKSFISVGESPARKKVLDRLFHYTPPVLLRDVNNGDAFVIMTNSGTFLGPFTAGKTVLNHLGVEVSVNRYSSGIHKVCGYNNFRGEAELDSGYLYLPHNSIVIKLASDVTFELDSSVNGAAKRRQFETLQMLGAELNLGFDGVEYSLNGRQIGTEPKVMEVLVVKEGIDPYQARSFVKQAQVTKFTKIYLTKAAGMSGDYAPADIPNYGQIPSESGDMKPNGAYNPDLAGAVQQTLPLNDGQVTESTIISELLQVPDMYEQIEEYLPDIEESIDKLGRILFMSRVHIHKLAETTDAESVFGFLAQLKAVYRMLGDNFIKLQDLVNGAQSMNFENEEG